MKVFKLLFYSSLFLLGIVLMVAPPKAESGGQGDLVYVIPVEKEVERGLEAFLNRSIQTAEEAGADHIVFEVHTPGGFVDAAGNIASLVRNTEVPTTAFIVGDALSAGAYISLNANEIVMAPGTRMGSAAVIDGSGNAAEDKAQSAWLASMREAAELNDRDPVYALAMADETIDISEYGAGEGNLLTLTPSQAMEVGYAEATVENREELLEYLNMEQAEVRETEITFAEQIARFVTNPIIIPILLSIGSLGLVLELYSPGFGVPGIMGASALFLYFFGHLVAGFAGWEAIILFGIGVVLIVLEVFSPSFGILGVLGIGAILASLVISSFSLMNILLSVVIAVIVTIIASIIFFKYASYKGPFRRVILTDQTNTEQGYVSNKNRHDIIGEIGEALTILRPSGTALLNDERLDVVSEGGYIEQGRKVKVISATGSRIVVREVAGEDLKRTKTEEEDE
ncbi:nodulation protein NfeD [Salipaludibacillus agaradhaerens]|uniref:NfeD family protein n=1 Tax=Salipaludibacillus agaradhaerens TaxID=76935 RepID=UPI002150D8C9|nr:nodulation protein NfeD [Salipaludibacillus agaradhaerens]MCR6106309.1 nodulation protein NfeD [Salipaludibacillus agaradhaerens]MCR6118342.1 nodulation protein NfeD [Salipaludibacillus agaradhaerens]UJW57450.1 nodulation protein NfeD [Bacillus sp. A116_S68]